MNYNGRALTIKQPFAWAIMAGYKTFEFRSWPPPGDVDDFVIHAGKIVNKAAYAQMSRYFVNEDGKTFMPGMADLQRGVGLGIAHIRAITPPGGFAPHWGADTYFKVMGYASHLFAWEIEVIHRFPEPIPAKGQLGLWMWKGETE